MKKGTQKEVQMIPLNLITPDENQPRKNFDVGRLAELIVSIKKYGIMEPLKVERRDDGTYLLWDGERRFRASKEIKLKEVPVFVSDPMSDTERLIQQFHVQEQHQGWNALEKAVAVSKLCRETKQDPTEIAKLLSLPHSTIREYVAFSKLSNKKEYMKYEIGIRFAQGILAIKNLAKKQYETVLEKEYTPEIDKELELAIVKRIKVQEINRPIELARVRDIIKTDASYIDKIIKREADTISKMFIESQAKSEGDARKAYNNAVNLLSQLRNEKALSIIRNDSGYSNTIKKLRDLLNETIM